MRGESLIAADGQRFDWLGCTAFRLVELVAAGRVDEARAWLQWAASTGFTLQRVLTMCAAAPDGGMFRLTPADGLAALPDTIRLCAEYGQYVEVVALAATERFGFGEAECRAHVRRVAAICAASNSTVLQIANEYQDGSHCDWLQDDIPHVHALSREIPNAVLYTESPPNGEFDEREQPQGRYLTRHRSRKDKWNNARRIIELKRLAGNVSLPVIDDEPSGAAEVPRGNARYTDPAFFYAQGLLTKFHNLAGTTFHSEAGLQAQVPGPTQQRCARALIEGFSFPPAREYRFENAKHSTSPVKDADFERVCRVFSFLHPSGSYAVALGVEPGGPAIVWQNGYRPLETLTPYGPELQVIRIAK